MWKRALSAILWFAATWVAYEIVWSLTGVPRLLGPVIAFGAATFVTLDPFGAFRSRRRVVSGPGSVEIERTLA
jgi:hypothetical protein